jgi:hypothetical protein
MLKVQFRKIRDWDLLFPYLVWKIREFKRGHRLTWADTFLHLLRRLIPLRLATWLFPDLVAERNRLVQRLGNLTAERDGAHNALLQLREEQTSFKHALTKQLGDMEAQRDGAHNALLQLREEQTSFKHALTKQLGDMEAQRDGAHNALLQLREEQTSFKHALTKQLGDMEAQRDGLGNELERVRQEAAWMARQYGKVLAQRDAVANELARLRTEVLGEMQHAGGSQARGDEHSEIAAENDQGQALAKRWLPPMLVTTMPKSGTYYISKLFSEGLSIESRIVSHQYFPDDVIRQPELRMLSMGNCISQDHFGPSKINLTHIDRHLDRMIVHLRDPRQALLSYVHYLDTERFRQKEEETLLFIYPPLPDDFYQLDLASRIDWAIANWLPFLVQWVEGWVAAANRSDRPRIKFTRYEDLVTDRDKFVSDVLDFFEIPNELLTPPDIAPDPEIHFRKGEINEWTQVFSAAQIAAANARIPAALASRFGWPLLDALRK